MDLTLKIRNLSEWFPQIKAAPASRMTRFWYRRLMNDIPHAMCDRPKVWWQHQVNYWVSKKPIWKCQADRDQIFMLGTTQLPSWWFRTVSGGHIDLGWPLRLRWRKRGLRLFFHLFITALKELLWYWIQNILHI